MKRRIKQVKKILRKRRINKMLLELLRSNLETPPLACQPYSETELHTVTSRFHLPMYILAVKSLLRFHDDIAVVVHDDGSLTGQCQDQLKRHIAGIRIISRGYADRELDKILRPYPLSTRYRNKVASSFQIFDYAFFSRAHKVISLDSDTLFLKSPGRLIKWMEQDEKKIIFSYEKNPCQQKEFLREFGCNYPPHVNIGLMCFYKDIVKLDLIEDLLARQRTMYDSCAPAMWVTAQNIFPILANNESGQYCSGFFYKEEYQLFPGFDEKAVFKHYLSSLDREREYVDYKNDSQKVIDELISLASKVDA